MNAILRLTTVALGTVAAVTLELNGFEHTTCLAAMIATQLAVIVPAVLARDTAKRQPTGPVR